MLGKMMNTPLLVSDLVKHADRYHGDTLVVSCETDGSTTESNWSEIHSNSKRLANALMALGLEQQDRVATIAWSNRRHLEIWYGVSGSGLVCHTINPRLFPEQLIYIINDADDKVVFFEDTFLPLIQAIKPALPNVEKFVCMTAPNEKVLAAIPDVVFYDDLVNAQSDDFEWPILDENQASSLCYTSGTTGNPKGVLYTHRTTIIHTYAISLPDAIGMSAQDIVMPVAPMFHANSWGLPYSTALAGAALILPGPKLDGDSLVTLIDTYQVTLALGVPTIWKGLIDAAKARGSKLSSLNRTGIGGTPCPESMFRTLRDDFDSDTIHAWGMTEMSPLGAMNRTVKLKHKDLNDDEMVARRMMQGRPSFGVELRIVDGEDNNRLLPNDGIAQGNIQARGYWVMDTYFGFEDSALESDGWFDTGDIASIDEDGYVTIRDRAKDLIKSGGEWISSVELETIALKHPAVNLAAAVGAYHPKWDERPVVIISVNPGHEVSEEELLDLYKENVASWQVPDKIIFVDDLPVSGTGKIDKKVLRQQYDNILAPRPELG
ncbi:long-chain-fatty-acid--CoA ligase [Psychrobacter arenosus]|uniref:long-chain-fatty-acid--CoA ligase n=1 Tax=Psychrobacter arenosus TaxID=256326 RepID=UPI00191A2A36|nr:long-chain-fatty-acid--CoA ligase [Psychrobacter arenosus]